MRQPSAALEQGAHALEMGNTIPDLLGSLGNLSMGNAVNTNQSVADYMGVTTNSGKDGAPVLSALCTNMFLILTALVVFFYLCRKFPEIYRTRMLDHTCPASSMQEQEPSGEISWWKNLVSTEMSWWKSVYAIPSSEAEQFCGLDGALMLDFLDLVKGIFLRMAVILTVVLVPTHWFSPDPEGVDPNRDWLAKTSILNVKRFSDWYWVHVVFTWIVVTRTMSGVYEAQKTFTGRRQKWLKERPWPQAMTILVQNIPTEYCTDEALTNYFLSLFPHEEGLKAMVVKRTDKLRRLIAQRADLDDDRMKLEAQRKQDEAAGKPQVAPSAKPKEGESIHPSKVDELVKITTTMEHLTQDIERERGWVILRAADKSVRSNSGFVTFTTRRSVYVAERLPYTINAFEFQTQHAPDPADVLYPQLAVRRKTQDRNWLVGVVLMCVLFITWLPITFLISSMTTLPVLREHIYLVDMICTWSPALQNFLQGFLGTAALHLIMSCIPMILGYIVMGFFSAESGAMVQTFILYWYFTFLVIFVVLVTTLSKCIIEFLGNPLRLIDILAITLPQASDFYINYVVIGCFTVSLELLRIPNLFYYHLYHAWLGRELAMQRSRDEDPIDYGMGARMSKISILVVVGLVFCTINPFVCVVVWIFLMVARTSYGYLLLWVETKKPDLGGELFVMALQQIIVGLFFYAMLMTGLLSLRAGKLKGLAVAPLIPLVALNFIYFRTGFTWRTLPFSEVAKIDREEGTGPMVASEEGETAGKLLRYEQEELRGIGGKTE